MSQKMDHRDELFQPIEKATFEAFRASAQKHRGEEYYSVALYTSGGYGYVVDTCSTVEGLRAVAEKYLAKQRYREEWGTLDVAMKELKWSPCDSPYHCEFDDYFTPVCDLIGSIREANDEDADDEEAETRYQTRCAVVHEACVAALTRLREAGLFADEVVFNVLMGDQSDEVRYVNAEPLNSAANLARLRSEWPLDEQRLAVLRANRGP